MMPHLPKPRGSKKLTAPQLLRARDICWVAYPWLPAALRDDEIFTTLQLSKVQHSAFVHLEHSEHEEERGLVEISMAASNEAVRSLRDRCKVRGVPGDAALSIRRLLLLVVLHSRAQKLERARAGNERGTDRAPSGSNCALSLRSPLDRPSPYGSGRKRESRRTQLLFVRAPS